MGGNGKLLVVSGWMLAGMNEALTTTFCSSHAEVYAAEERGYSPQPQNLDEAVYNKQT